MKKRILVFLLAITMLAQTITPAGLVYASGPKPENKKEEKLVKIGELNIGSYINPEDLKVRSDSKIEDTDSEPNKENIDGLEISDEILPEAVGGYFEDGNEPKEEDKPKYYGNVKVNFEVKGLDEKPFQWNEIFGVDSEGNPNKARLVFTQINDDSGSEISERILEVTEGGKYIWSDEDGNPTDLPLFGRNNEPLFYEVRVDERVSDKVQLLTATMMSSENASPTFEKPDENGLIKFHLTLGLVLQQTASTKFVSEWKTKVPEADRPQVQADGLFKGIYMGNPREKSLTIDLPKNDKDIKIVRDLHDEAKPDLIIAENLYRTPEVKLAENSSKTPFTRDDIDDDTMGGDYYWKPITYKGHSYMPSFKYDVINGGKLTMTEVIPITFDPLDGIFDDHYINKKEENRTKPYKIWVEYGGSIQNRVPRSVIKDGQQFLGWSSTKTNGVPNPKSDFDNIIMPSTYYPVFWSDVIEYNNFPEEASYYNSVKVHVDLTDKAVIDTSIDPKAKQKRNFTVDPTHRVTLPVGAPVGKTGKDDQGRSFTWKFSHWKEVKGKEIGRKWYVDDVNKLIRGNFNEETWIEAVYEKDYTSNNEQVETFVTHESKEGINNFLPTFEDLQKQIRIKKGNDFVALDKLEDAEKVKVEYVPGDGYTDFNTEIYDKLQEKKNPDENGVEAPTRIENIKAKLTYPDGEVKEVDIPIKVYKNIYEAKTETQRPVYVPKDYIKVTLDPTTKAKVPQKTYYYVNPEAQVVIPGEDPEGKGDNKFVKWINKDTGANYKLPERHQFAGETTIEAQYVSDVIPANDDGSKPDTVPSNFVEVKFVPTDNATDETKAEKIFWVNPKKEVTIPVKDPVGKQYFTFKEWKDAKGNKYTPSTPKKFAEATIITATYDEAKNIISYDPNEPITRPDGYVRVTFAADPGLKLTEQKAYYVKKNAKDKEGNPITLGNPDLAKPAYKEETGYKFEKWDKEDTTTIAKDDILVIAKDKTIPDFVEKTDKNPNKPDEKYVAVTFKADDSGNGTVTEKTYFVNPNKYVELTPPKDTKGNTGYEFGAWSENLSNYKQYTKDTVITASFNPIDSVIPKVDENTTKPDGYVEVTFVIDQVEGKNPATFVDGQVATYFVDPNRNVTIQPPKTNAKTGYEFEKWDQDTFTKAKKYAKDTTVKGSFKKLDDIIPSKNEKGESNAKPNGYVSVIFIEGQYGTIKEGQTVYYVKPDTDVTVPAPTINPNKGYNFDGWNKSLTVKLQESDSPYIIVAKYTFLESSSARAGYVFTKEGVQPSPDDYIKVITPAMGKKISSVNIIQRPDVNKPGLTSASVRINYTDGTSEQITVRVYVESKYNTGDIAYPYPENQQGGGLIARPAITMTEYKEREVLRREVRYMQGFEGKFRPKDSLTRAEAAQILANALKEDGYKFDSSYKLSYKDIQGKEWYAEAIRITTQADVFKGYDDGNFRPDQKITRAEWISTLRRFQYIDEAEGNSMKLRSDHWAISEIEAAYKEGWLKIYQDGLVDFAYDKAITRQEVAAISNKAFNRVLDKKFILDKNQDLINYSDVTPDMWAYEDILCASNTFLHKSQGKYLGYESGPKTYSIDIKDAVVEQDLFQRISR